MATLTAGAANAESAAVSASVQVASVVLSVSLSTSSPTIRVGDSANVVATVANIGTGRASRIDVSLHVDAVGLRVRGSDVITIAQLQPGRTKTATWSVCALQVGNYVLLARATVDGVAFDGPAVVLSVSGQRRKAC